MSADLHIHVLDGVNENDLSRFFSHTMGSKWFNLSQPDSDNYGLIGDTPNIWIGSVSWLKAAIFEDTTTYVPRGVAAINALIGEELPVLTPELRESILAALREPNTTGYKLADPDTVAVFLDAHMGQKLFTVSW